MTPDEYTNCDASALIQLAGLGQVTPREIVTSAFEALSELNETYHFLAFMNAPDFNEPSGGCVPTLVKDIGGHIAGFPFWNASRLFDGELCGQDSNFGRMLKDAGGHPLGVSTAPEFSLEANCRSDLFGETLNPWDPARSPGGSSGGAAVAVSTGAVPVAHASDIAGSIRLPAAWCGIVGLKPSRGRGSAGPLREEAGFGLASNFVVTRTVRDTALFLDKLSHAFPGDPFEVAVPEHGFVGEIENLDTGPLSVALTLPEASNNTDAEEITVVVQRIARELEDQGHNVVPVSRSAVGPEPDALVSLVTVWHGGFARQIDEFATRTGRKANAATLGATALAAYEYSRRIDLDAFLDARQHIFAVRRHMAATLAEFDIWLTPTSALIPPRWDEASPVDHGQSLVDHAVEKMFPAFEFTFGHNISGNPAISLPLGETSRGLPVGVQLSAKFGREDLLLKLAKRLEDTPHWVQKPPVRSPHRLA